MYFYLIFADFIWFLLKQTYARPEATAAGHAQYAANITAKVLSFYEEYFGINYQQNTLGKTALMTVMMGWEKD